VVPRLGRRQWWTEVASDVDQRGGQERGRAEAVWEEEGKGEEPSLAPDKGCPNMGSGGDRW
jgi:hypothetical protein